MESLTHPEDLHMARARSAPNLPPEARLEALLSETRVFRPPAALAVALLALTLLEPGGGGAALAARRPRPQVGLASYYAHEWHGHRTASGERYDMRAMTASHRTLPSPSR